MADTHQFEKLIYELRQYSNSNHHRQDWQYIEGNSDSHKVWAKLFGIDAEQYRAYTKCLCGTNITFQQQRYIKHKRTKDIKVICDSCTKYFTVQSVKKDKCQICRENNCRKDSDWCRECGGSIMNCGKYKGQPYRWILVNDATYCKWAKDYGENSTMYDFSVWLLENGFDQLRTGKRFRTTDLPVDTSKKRKTIGETVMKVGKHKDRNFYWIKDHDKGYCHFISNLDDPIADFRLFREWLQTVKNTD